MGRHTAFEPEDPQTGPVGPPPVSPRTGWAIPRPPRRPTGRDRGAPSPDSPRQLPDASGDRRRAGGFAGHLDIAAVRADDELLDRIRADFTAGHDLFEVHVGAGPGFWSVDAMETLLTAWQDELSAAPMPATPSLGKADWALRKGRRQGLRPMIAVGAAICALLIGSAGVGSRLARPGDALWPLTTVLWSDRVASAHAGEKVTRQLNVASSALDLGDPTGASTALTSVSVDLPEVQSLDGHDRLSASYVQLKDQVSSRLDPTQGSETESTGIDLGTAATGADPTSRWPIPQLGSRTPGARVIPPAPTTRPNSGPNTPGTTPVGPTVSTPPFATPTTGQPGPVGPVTSSPPSAQQSTPTTPSPTPPTTPSPTTPTTTPSPTTPTGSTTPTASPTSDPEASPTGNSVPTTSAPESSSPDPTTAALAPGPTDGEATISTSTTPASSTDLDESVTALPSDGQQQNGSDNPAG